MLGNNDTFYIIVIQCEIIDGGVFTFRANSENLAIITIVSSSLRVPRVYARAIGCVPGRHGKKYYVDGRCLRVT